jgi:dipeptidase E
MSQRVPQIIAMGGGGFTMEPDNPALDRYVLEAAGKSSPSICFLPTAAGDDEQYLASFYEAFERFDCRASHFLFFARTGDLRSLLSYDILYVGGGNSKSMLGVWREWGLPEVLREAWAEGVVLAGVSAGAVCWFEQFLSDAWADGLSVIEGLGFLPGSCCPHFEFESERRPALHRRLERGEIRPGYAIANSAALHFRGADLLRAVASVPGKRSLRYSARGGRVEEEELAMEVLDR